MDRTSDRSARSGNGYQPHVDGAAKYLIFPSPLVLTSNGGAISSTGEKFAAILLTGTGSSSVLIAASRGCCGLIHQFSILLDLCTGNEHFGLGRIFSLIPVDFKTRKPSPKYRNPDDSEICIAAGAKNLAAASAEFNDKTRRVVLSWQSIHGESHQVQRHQSRITEPNIFAPQITKGCNNSSSVRQSHQANGIRSKCFLDARSASNCSKSHLE